MPFSVCVMMLGFCLISSASVAQGEADRSACRETDSEVPQRSSSETIPFGCLDPLLKCTKVSQPVDINKRGGMQVGSDQSLLQGARDRLDLDHVGDPQRSDECDGRRGGIEGFEGSGRQVSIGGDG